MTTALILTSLVVFFRTSFVWSITEGLLVNPDYAATIERLAFMPAQPNLWNMVTSLFVHVGWLHLAVNLWCLWLFGAPVEARLPNGWWYLGGFFIGGGLADAAHWLFSTPDARLIPCAGASGAISALMGVFVVWFPRGGIRCWAPWDPNNAVTVPANLLLLGWFLYQLLSQYVVEQLRMGLPAADVNTTASYWAHIGGFVAGAAAAWLTRARWNATLTSA